MSAFKTDRERQEFLAWSNASTVVGAVAGIAFYRIDGWRAAGAYVVCCATLGAYRFYRAAVRADGSQP